MATTAREPPPPPPPPCRHPSDSPDASPALPAAAARPDLSRCLSSVSTASSASHGSRTDPASRDSLGSDLPSRHSSGSFHSRRSDVSSLSVQSAHAHPSAVDRKGRRRGYVRPQATDFAASARSRESVMSLGSIAHLQYYFARTGLLDGKGGQLARKKQNQRAATLDMAVLASTTPAASSASASPSALVAADADSSYASMGSSPDLAADGLDAVSLPADMADGDHDYYDDSFTESDPGMLPPTVSTYHHKEPHVPKPPTIVELKADLESCLGDAAAALREADERKTTAAAAAAVPDAPRYPNMPEEKSQGWYELQGMHILDVLTLAIRAAKVYYTAHELPDRLDSIKSEKQVRADLLAVMEVLKQMATRGFKGGMRDDEMETMRGWIGSVSDMLDKEQEMEAAERAERASWTWLRGDWSGRDLERERAFLMSMDPGADPLPPWTPVAEAAHVPTPFLQSMQNGLRLVKLHNAVVDKSRRRFGAIPTFHTDTQKPYRCADNLRYWVKAAELRFEVLLTVDVLGVVYNSGRQPWLGLEAALLKWCRHVREEIAGELDGAGRGERRA